MGPANKNGKCATCYGNFDDCPGHFGSLTLALPVFNIGYFGAILEILKCICKSCSRVLLEEKICSEYLKKMRNSNFDSLRKTELKEELVQKCSVSTEKIQCWRCGYQNGEVRKDKSLLTIFHDRPRMADGKEKSSSSFSKPSPLNPVEVLALYKRMQDQDCELLYLNDRPEKLIWTVIPVPPIAIRPPISSNGKSYDSDITVRLQEIIKKNVSLNHELQEASSEDGCRLQWGALQNAVALYINSKAHGGTYINSEAHVGTSFQQQSSKQLSGFVQRMSGKKGHFGRNLSGKRVNYTGRTVISPDPNLKITEVGIPIHMALSLTYPERVTHHNIEKLRQCVRNGRTYPGANFVRDTNGDWWDLSFGGSCKSHKLKFGDIVHRHLEDGDVVLLNRNPSLHRMSIMCHRARIMQGRTLRLNESVCNPYNANFDGDEMNLHVPQTEEARTESLMLMGVQNNLCHPKNGVALVASTQDLLTSSFLITRRDTFYDRAAFSMMCCYMGDAMDHIDLPNPAISRPIELWTGKQLFNVLLRPNAKMRVYVNLMVREKNCSTRDDKASYCLEETMCPSDGFVYFRNSELISGQLGKATLGNGNNIGLYSVLLRDYNAHAAAACMNRLAKFSARWIGEYGFSVGIDDVQSGHILYRAEGKSIDEVYNECDVLNQSYNARQLPLLPGCNAAQTLEAKITETLHTILDTNSNVCMRDLHWRNSLLIMSQCGSKGSPINISQMVASVGQQIVGGLRPLDGFIDRSLPHFPRKSKTAASSVDNLEVLPAIFKSKLKLRQSDKARTRSLTKWNSWAKGFVANSFYTGLSATEFFFHSMGGREGLVHTVVKTADTGYTSDKLMKALDNLAVYYDMTVRNSSGTIIQFLYGDDGMDPAKMEGAEGFSLDFGRLLVKAQATCAAGKNSSLSLYEVKENTGKRLSQHAFDSNGVPSLVFKKLFEFIETAVGKNKWRITQKQLEVFLDDCISRLRSKGIEAGTSVGAITAQSIGESGTQMMLKNFHFAGVPSTNVTLGVSRIKEIIAARKKISTPIITAKLEDDDNMQIAQSIKGHIAKTLLAQVIKSGYDLVGGKLNLELLILQLRILVGHVIVQIAKNIKFKSTPHEKVIVVELDLETISALCLNMTIENIRETISQYFRINSKVIKELCVEIKDEKELWVIPTTDSFGLYWLKNRLPKVVIKGISTVERAIIAEEEGNTGKLQLIVEGTGLLEVMGMEGLKGCYTESNHIMEVCRTLGIEAARMCIINEMKKVMQSHSMQIDIRHMMLLADIMTYQGEILAMTRAGISKMKQSVLMQASLEKTVDHLFNASVIGKEEKIAGVTECIIMGVPIQIGTGLFKVMQRVPEGPALDYGSDPVISTDK